MVQKLLKRACTAVFLALPIVPALQLGAQRPAVDIRSVAGSSHSLLLSLPSVRNGQQVMIGKGQSPVILAVFATWCRSCKDEVATFNSLQKEFEPLGVRVIAISADEGSPDRLVRWLDAHKASYPVVRDTSNFALRALGVVGVPEVHVVDGNGRITWSRRGPVESQLTQLRAAIARLNP